MSNCIMAHFIVHVHVPANDELTQCVHAIEPAAILLKRTVKYKHAS